MKSRLYPNGFMFTNKHVKSEELPSHYKKSKITNDFLYYYDQYSNKVIYFNADQFIIIHGLFIHLDLIKGNITKDSPEILLDLYFNNKEEFLRNLNFCGGRFVIIIGDSEHFEVYPDASAMRTVYVEPEENIIGSHINMMYDLFDFSKELNNKTAIKYTKLWDNTLYQNIKSINPNFYYSSKIKKTIRFFPNKVNKYNEKNLETKLSIFEFLWKEQLDYFKKQYDSVIFSITGGEDSRVSLALSKKHLSDFKFFTYAPGRNVKKYSSKFLKTLSKDKEIVDQLLDVIPLNHTYLFFKEIKKELTEYDISILDKNSPYIHGRFLLPYYNYYFPEFSTLHVRGNLFEIGRAYFIRRSSTNSKKDIFNIVSPIMKKNVVEKTDEKLIEKDIESNIQKFNYDKNNFGYHVLDLYYWEIRMGRWMAEVLNETDYSFETLLPFNMREIMDISLSFNLEERQNSFLFDELINKNYPVLNFFGKNNPKNLYEQQKEKDSIQYFDIFKVYKSNGEKVGTVKSTKNEIFNPKKNMSGNNYSEVVFNYSTSRGNLKLVLFGKYKNKKAKDYLHYQILVNNKLKLEEDIALWNISTDILLTGLEKHDKVQLKIISRRKSNTSSWEKASTIKVIEYTEIYSKDKGSLGIYSNSPHAILK